MLRESLSIKRYYSSGCQPDLELLLTLRKGRIVMSKLTIPLITLLALLPSTLTAQTPPESATRAISAAEFAYSNYVLSEKDTSAIMDKIVASCPTKSDDVGSIFAAEARYQTACLGKQVARLEKRHKKDYVGSKSDLSEQAQRDFSVEYLGWVKTRYADCDHDRSENLGGAMKNAIYNSCRLFELKRRAKWRGVSY
jgi:uncharacterized protein YecT (DUF1311 family)